MQAAARFRAMKAVGTVVAPTDTVLVQFWRSSGAVMARLWRSSPDRATTRAAPHAD